MATSMTSTTTTTTNGSVMSTLAATNASTTTSAAVATTATTTTNVMKVSLRRSLVPPRWASSVRVLGMAECKEAALCLAHAFATDELSQYICDAEDMAGLSAEDKWRLHVEMFDCIVAQHCMDGLVTAIGPDHDTVALWVTPGQNLDGWWTFFRSGLWRLYLRLSNEGKKRYFDELQTLLHDTKARVLGERDNDAYYLVFLGTKPGSQGRGYAGKVLEHMMQRADSENRPMYLESSSLANNGYYAKFGFEPHSDVFLRRGPKPVRLSIMVREPRTAARKVGGYSSSNNVNNHNHGNVNSHGNINNLPSLLPIKRHQQLVGPEKQKLIDA